jgi:hypothetical protein
MLMVVGERRYNSSARYISMTRYSSPTSSPATYLYVHEQAPKQLTDLLLVQSVSSPLLLHFLARRSRRPALLRDRFMATLYCGVQVAATAT